MALVFLTLLTHCATYWQNRYSDAGDVISAGYQQQSYGLSLRAGPAKVGLHHKSEEGLDAGYRQGYTGQFKSQSFVALLLGSDILTGPVKPRKEEDPSGEQREKSQLRDTGAPYSPSDGKRDTPPASPGDEAKERDADSRTAEDREKNKEAEEKARKEMERLLQLDVEQIKQLPEFQALSPEQQKQFLEQFEKLKKQSEEKEETSKEAPGPPSEMELRGKTYRSRSPLGTSVPFKEKNPLLKSEKDPVSEGFAPASYLTTIEIKLGAFSGFYFAFHAGELVDLLAGFAGWDPMSDDGPLEHGGLTEEQKKNLSPEERELLRNLTPEQRKQFLELSPEQRRRILQGQTEGPGDAN